jgi:hypothetical protein
VVAPPPAFDQAVAIQHRVHGTDGRHMREANQLPAQLLANLRCPPVPVLPLQPDNRRFNLRRQPIDLTIRSPTAIRQPRDAAILVALEDLVPDALSTTKAMFAFPVFERAFKEFGLPLAIRTDNGLPFAADRALPPEQTRRLVAPAGDSS